jgi:hypothetical protein
MANQDLPDITVRGPVVSITNVAGGTLHQYNSPFGPIVVNYNYGDSAPQDPSVHSDEPGAPPPPPKDSPPHNSVPITAATPPDSLYSPVIQPRKRIPVEDTSRVIEFNPTFSPIKPAPIAVNETYLYVVYHCTEYPHGFEKNCKGPYESLGDANNAVLDLYDTHAWRAEFGERGLWEDGRIWWRVRDQEGSKDEAWAEKVEVMKKNRLYPESKSDGWYQEF